MPKTEYFFEVAIFGKGRVAVRYTDSYFLTLSGSRLRLIKASKVRPFVYYSRLLPVYFETYMTSRSWLTRALEDRCVFLTQREFMEQYATISTIGQKYYNFTRHFKK